VTSLQTSPGEEESVGGVKDTSVKVKFNVDTLVIASLNFIAK
jgi:hypothetical protein